MATTRTKVVTRDPKAKLPKAKLPKAKRREETASQRAARRVERILTELRAMGGTKQRAAMARVGINIENSLGISLYDLRAHAQRLGTDHELALRLWRTGTQEARLLACFVDDPAAVTEQQCERWALDFDSWNVCDQATTSLFDQTKHAWPKAVEWATREEEWVRRAAFALMAGLAVHDKTAPDDRFVALFPLIEQAAFDPRNFVKKAVNWALRNIGKRNLSLNQAAVACAKRLLVTANDGRGGPRGRDAASRSARWVATDALRELESEKTLSRLNARSKTCRARR